MTTRECDLMVRANRVLGNKGETRRILEITLPRADGGAGLIRMTDQYTYIYHDAPAATSRTEGRVCQGKLSQLIAFAGAVVIPAADHAAGRGAA